MTDPATHQAALRNLPGSPLFRGDERITPYSGDVVLSSDPEAVIRARDLQDIAEVLAYCHAHYLPVTFSGGRTGLTGASATRGGVLIATEQASRLVDMGTSDGRPYVVAQPGILLGDLKERVEGEGLFYPPDPTSYHEACLGGTVATNATGEDTLLYGPTRKYVRALKAVRADGRIVHLERPLSDRPPESKGTAGYIRAHPELDLLIGSEGTLAYIAELTLDLLPDPGPWWAAIAFFPSWQSAIAFTRQAMRSKEVTPRAMEYLDAASLDILRADVEIPPLPEAAKAAIYWKQEYHDEVEQSQKIEAWMKLLEACLQDTGHRELTEAIWVAQTDAEQQRFRGWRHRVPVEINERVSRHHQRGGGKIASDWWVPLKHLEAALEEALRESAAAGLETLVFGHIGNGHPHINYIARDAAAWKKGKELIRRQCTRAVKWGGGVAGEHGIGKVYRDLLSIQHSPAKIAEMMQIKRTWDPHWILGRGTLFEVPDWVK